MQLTLDLVEIESRSGDLRHFIVVAEYLGMIDNKPNPESLGREMGGVRWGRKHGTHIDSRDPPDWAGREAGKRNVHPRIQRAA